MIKRRQFNAAMLVSLVAGMPNLAKATGLGSGQLFHASIGRQLMTYRVDVSNGRLIESGPPAAAPEEIQFGWAHPNLPILYIASSDQNTIRRGRHFLSAFAIGSNGIPSPLGPSVPLAERPIHLTVDLGGCHVLTAYNSPSNVSVHRIADDGGIGEMVVQQAVLDTGVYPHQIRVMPSNAAVLVPARGVDPRGSALEQAGSLRIYAFADGQLSQEQIVAPAGGMGFRPRHVDFAPSGEWAYVALESQNAIQAYRLMGNRLSDEPLHTASTLDNGEPPDPGQRVSGIRVHPNGRFLYVANRGTRSSELPDGRTVSLGDNSVAVFDLASNLGLPHLIQTIDVRGVHPRTIDISADGKWLVAGSIRPALVRKGNAIVALPAGITLFRILSSGVLEFSHKLDVTAEDQPVFWVGAWR